VYASRPFFLYLLIRDMVAVRLGTVMTVLMSIVGGRSSWSSSSSLKGYKPGGQSALTHKPRILSMACMQK
jgi:hypothetical protein